MFPQRDGYRGIQPFCSDNVDRLIIKIISMNRIFLRQESSSENLWHKTVGNIRHSLIQKERTSFDAVNSVHGRHFVLADGTLRASDKITGGGGGGGSTRNHSSTLSPGPVISSLALSLPSAHTHTKWRP